MSEKAVTETEETGDTEPLTIQELLNYAVQDLLTGESSELLTDTFFDEFVSQNREETQQILMILDMPNETIIQMLVQSQLQGIELLKQNSPKFLNELRNSVNLRLAEMAQTAAAN